MQSRRLPAIAILASLCGLAAGSSATARPYAHPQASAPPTAYPASMRHRMHRPRARMLPPEVRYRDPSVDLRPRGQPDFLIHAYLPRYTEAPMYNEPPERFPQR